MPYFRDILAKKVTITHAKNGWIIQKEFENELINTIEVFETREYIETEKDRIAEIQPIINHLIQKVFVDDKHFLNGDGKEHFVKIETRELN